MNPNPGRSIALQTYTGTSLPNWIDLDPAPAMIAAASQEYERRYPRTSSTQTRLIHLREATGRYNCHGLTFASRRSWVCCAVGELDADADVWIPRILHEDGYQPLASHAAPAPGDVVVYRSAPSPGNLQGEVEHTGLVSRVEAAADRDIIGPSVYVISKWGAFREYEHLLRDCPYSNPEYWRLG